MKIITAMPGVPVEIGRTGENHAIKVLFKLMNFILLNFCS